MSTTDVGFIDRGGIQYRIEVEGNGQERLDAFRQSLVRTRRSFRGFREDIRSLASDSRSAARSLDSLSRASRTLEQRRQKSADTARRQLDTERGLGRQSQTNVRNLRRQAREEKKLTNFQRERARLQRQLQALQRSGPQARELSALRRRLATTRQIVQAEERLRTLQSLASQGRDVRTGELQSEQQKRLLLEAQSDLRREQTSLQNTGLQAARRDLEILKERSRLESQQAQLQNRALQEARRELAVTEKILRAEQRLETIRQFSREGRNIQTGELLTEQQTRLTLEAQNALKVEQAKLDNRALRAASAQLAAIKAIAREEQKLATQQALRDQGRLPSGLTPEQAVQQDLNRRRDRLQQEETRQRLLRTNREFRNQQREIQRLERRVGAAGQRFGGFNNRLRRTESQANRISFTFRRLIGIFAAFQALRLGADFFRQAIQGGIRFNALIERAELGVASLFTAVGEVRDPFGGLVSRSQQLAQAQGEARRQTQLLRADSLQTLATFEQLLDTFQVAVAPGFAAGLGVDQIRQLSVSISQAAAAIGVPQEQLAEEIRSLLSGTIQARTTRIATALGITNEDIRRARELGVLAEFLQERFAAFGVAGEEALSTFDGLLARVRDGFAQLSGAGGIEFFEEIKLLLRDIIDFLQFENPQGFLEPNPEALAIINALLSGLTEAVRVARELREQLTLQDLFATAQGLGNAIGVLARVVSVVVQGVVAGVATLGRLFGGLLNVLGAIAEAFGASNIESFLASLVQVATVFLGIQLTLGILGSAFGALLLPVRALIVPITLINGLLGRWGLTLTSVIGPAFRGIARSVLAIFSPIGLIVAGLIAIGIITKQWLDDIFGVELSIREAAKIVREVLAASFAKAVLQIRLGFNKFFNFLENGFELALQGVQEIVLELVDVLLRGAALFSDEAQKLRDKLKETREDDRTELAERIAAREKAIKKLESDIEKQTEGINAALAKNLGDIINEANQDDESFLESIGLGGVQDALDDIFGDADLGLDGAQGQAEGLVAALDEIPVVIGRGQREVDGLAQSLQRLDDQVRQAQGQLSLAVGGQGIEGNALAVRRELLQGQVDLLELSRQIEEERQGILAQQIDNQVQLNQLSERARSLDLTDLVQEGVRLAETRNSLLNEEATLQEELRSIQRGINNAEAEGDDARLSSLSEQQAALEEQLRQTEQSIAAQETLLEGFPEAAGDPEAQAELNDLIVNRISLQAQEISNEDRLTALREQQLRLEETRAQLATTRIAAVAQQELQQLGDRLALSQAELQAEQLLFAARSRFGNLTAAQQLAQQQARITIEQRRFDLERAALERQRVAGEQNLRVLDAAVNLAERRRRQVQELADAQLASAQEVENAEAAVASAVEARRVVQSAQTTELRAQTAELELQGLRLQGLREQADQFRQDQIDNPISAGLSAGLDDFIVDATDTFANFREIARSALNDVSGAFADEILNAISGDSTFGEALSSALQGIARQILQNAIREGLATILSSVVGETVTNEAELARREALLLRREVLAVQEQANFGILQSGSGTLAQAVAGLAAPATTLAGASTTLSSAVPGLSTAAGTLGVAALALQEAARRLAVANAIGAGVGGGGGGAGTHQGGLISHGGAASPAHFKNPQGLAGGGQPRMRARYKAPPGLHPSDRIPIWAAKDEFMHPVEAVRRYGLQSMEAIRRGLIDPDALSALVGSRAPLRVTTPKVGFQTGGAVTAGAGARSPAFEDDERSGSAASVGFIIGEDEADLFFAQGINALLERMSQEKSKFRAALGV